MDNWKASLDKYLTQGPPDDSWWFEKCADLIACNDDCYNIHYRSIDKWMERLFQIGSSPEYAAYIITKLLVLKSKLK